MAVGAGGVFVSFHLYFVVLERVVLMVVSRAFTQLAADRQFAHLGLMLLGVLAQVDQAVAPFAPGLPDDMAVVETADTAPVVVPIAPDQDTEMEPAASDMGVAVSRDEIMASIERDPTAPRTTSSTPAQPQQPRSTSLPTRRVRELITAQTRGGVKTEPASKQSSLTPSLPPAKPPKKKKRGDEFDDIFGSLDTSTKPTNPASSKNPSSADMANSEKPKKKKARAGPADGDEFDSIFGSLDSSSSGKKLKKKRKKGGDEFDDIFGGL